jgi:signal transduction histidine kinase
MNGIIEEILNEIDREYQDAVLSNYSHEQLSPLNSIINNSMILIHSLKYISSNISPL